MVQFSLLFQIFPANPRCKLRVGYMLQKTHEVVKLLTLNRVAAREHCTGMMVT